MDARTGTGPLVVSNNRLAPLVVIVGQTASGKTALALQLAAQFNGEIICADSRTIYKGMDIGTAKPTPAEQQQIKHHVIDVVAPNQAFSVADFKKLANQAITDITSRGKLPIMVGGSGLYIDAVLFDFDFRPLADPQQRQALESLSVEDLQARLQAADIPLPQNARNPRHLVRALETGGAEGTRKPLRDNTLIVGLLVDDSVLRGRIHDRIETMLQDGFLDEVIRLAGRYGWDAPGLQAPGYRAFRTYLEGDATLEQAKALFEQNDWQLARRQRTWFKRNPSIHWDYDLNKIVDTVTTFLSK